MNKKIALIAVMAAAAVVLCGCISPKNGNDMQPSSEFDFNPKTGEFHGKFPKDHQIGFAEVKRETNGMFSVTLTNVNSRINPDVVTASGQAQAEQLKAITDLYRAQGEMVNGMFKLLLDTASKVAK